MTKYIYIDNKRMNEKERDRNKMYRTKEALSYRIKLQNELRLNSIFVGISMCLAFT